MVREGGARIHDRTTTATADKRRAKLDVLP